MDTITKTNPSSNFGYESPTTDVTPLFAEGVLCGSSKLDIANNISLSVILYPLLKTYKKLLTFMFHSYFIVYAFDLYFCNIYSQVLVYSIGINS